MIDLQEEYKGIESNVTQKYSSEQQLYAKQLALEMAQSKNRDMLKMARYDLDFAIKKYVTELQTELTDGEQGMKIRVPHFKKLYQ